MNGVMYMYFGETDKDEKACGRGMAQKGNIAYCGTFYEDKLEGVCQVTDRSGNTIGEFKQGRAYGK